MRKTVKKFHLKIIINPLHVFMKNFIFHNKIIRVFYSSSNVLIVIVEDNWIFVSTFACNLVCYVVLVQLYEENPASHRHIF